MEHLRSDAKALGARWELSGHWWLSTPALILAIALGYYLLAVLADNLTLPGAVTAIWPASGLGVAAIIAFGFRVWPAIVLGIYFNQVTWTIRDYGNAYSLLPWQDFAHQSLVGLSYAAGNCLEALIIAFLIRRFVGRGNPLSSSGDVIRFIAFAALLGPVVGSLSGTLVTCGIWGWTPWSAFWPTFLTWWVSAAAGILIVAPPLLYLYYKPAVPLTLSPLVLLEFTALLGVASLIVAVTFYSPYPFEYLSLLTLLWAAFRFNQCITSWLAGALMMVATVATSQGHGPFAQTSSESLSAVQSLTLLQCFIVTLTGSAMVVAATVADRRRASEALLESNKTLEQRVASRTHEINQRAEEARKANEAKSRFLAAAGHDLRQPLYTLRLLVDTMLDKLNEQSACGTDLNQDGTARSFTPQAGLSENADLDQSTRVSLREISRKMSSGIEHMGKMFGGILDISRLDARAVEACLGQVALDELIRNVQQDYSTVAQSRGLNLHFNCPPLYVRTDPVLFERILRNLLDNALKYTNVGSVAILAKRVDSGVTLSVEDTGVGIPQERQQAVFDEFYQLDDGNGSVQRGLGLGLSIVRQLCHLLGHDLSLESSPGNGTTVTVMLETAVHTHPDSATMASGFADDELHSTDSMEAPCRVLIAGCNESIDKSTITLLEQWGYEVRFLPPDQSRPSWNVSTWQPDVLIVKAALLGAAESILKLHSGPDSANPLISIIAIGLQTEPDEELAGGPSAIDRVSRTGGLLYVKEPIKPAQLRSALRASLRKIRRASDVEHSC